MTPRLNRVEEIQKLTIERRFSTYPPMLSSSSLQGMIMFHVKRNTIIHKTIDVDHTTMAGVPHSTIH